MRFLLFLTILTQTSAWAQEPVPPELKAPATKKKTNLFDSLPKGATLKKFSHPSFDENHAPVSLLTADQMVITSTEEFTGTNLKLRLFDDQKQVKTIATMAEASFWIDPGHLEATGRIFLRSLDDQFAAEGPSGLICLKTKQGLIHGPARTAFQLSQLNQKNPTAMKLSVPLLLATMPLLTAATPVPMSAEDIEVFEQAVLPGAAQPSLNAQALGEFERKVAPGIAPQVDVSETIEESEKHDADLMARLTSFLQISGQTQLLTQIKNEPAPVAKPLSEAELFLPGIERMVIEAEKGIYFDGENQEFVYLGKVKLATKNLTMVCNNGVKAIMLPPAKKEKKAKDEKESLQAFGDLKQITANGGIILKGVNEKGEPLEARADRALYDKQKNEIILRGNGMFYRSGNIAAHSKDSKAITRIKILENQRMKLSLDGKWKLGLPTNTLSKKKKK